MSVAKFFVTYLPTFRFVAKTKFIETRQLQFGKFSRVLSVFLPIFAKVYEL